MLNSTTRYQSAIRSSGLRLTRQRQEILDVLNATHEHLDAEGIHDRLKSSPGRISLATVYRTLAVLKGMGLVEENTLGEEHGHYEMTAAPHHHFTCTRCGTVIEFADPAVMAAAQSLASREGARVTGVTLFIRGICSPCQKAESHSPAGRDQ